MKRGLIIGKFFPLHRGHCFLIDMAQEICDELFVFLCSRKSESISGDVRYAWLRATFPRIQLYHITKEIGEAKAGNPSAPKIWSEEIIRHLEAQAGVQDVDYVFASEDYGHELATHMGAKFVMIDSARNTIAISGSEIREKPYVHWDYLAEEVKPYFVKTIAVRGDREKIFMLAEECGALYCESYFDIAQANSVSSTATDLLEHTAILSATDKTNSTLQKKIIGARLHALCRQDYPLIILDISSHCKNSELERYEASLCEKHFEIYSAEDLAQARKWCVKTFAV